MTNTSVLRLSVAQEQNVEVSTSPLVSDNSASQAVTRSDQDVPDKQVNEKKLSPLPLAGLTCARQVTAAARRCSARH